MRTGCAVLLRIRARMQTSRRGTVDTLARTLTARLPTNNQKTKLQTIETMHRATINKNRALNKHRKSQAVQQLRSKLARNDNHLVVALFVFIHLGNSVTSAEMLVDSCFVYNRITKIVALLAAAASEERKATKNETVREFCVSRATLGH